MTRILLAIVFSVGGLAQTRFDVASVKRSLATTGGDGEVTAESVRFAARNVTLKRLLFEAWRIPYAQISGPAWINSAEYDVDARAGRPTSSDELRAMLRDLLTARFRLEIRQGEREQRVYILTVAKGGPRLTSAPLTGPWVHRFRGDLSEFANFLAVQLTIPAPGATSAPNVPSFAAGTPTPVLDKTGIDGVHDLAVELQLDQTNDTFTLWQRALGEQLGLRLESGRATAPFLTVLRATREPVGN